MIEIPIPVSEFLDCSLAASVESGYIAFLVLIARTADGKSLQDEVLQHWESFDDLTNDQILVISSKSSNDHYAACVHRWHEPEGYVSHSLKFDSATTREWDRRFCNSVPLQTLRKTPFFVEYGAKHMSRRPANAENKKAAMTAAATETARYFGVPESWLPCVVFLSLQEHQLLIVSVDDSFSLYSFVRTVLIDIEPSTREVKRLIERVGVLDEMVKILERQIYDARRPLRNADRRHVHMLNSWNEQVNAICRSLEELNALSSECDLSASTMISFLWDADTSAEKLDEACRELLSNIRDVFAKGKVPEYLVNRINSRLPRVIQKKRDRYLSDQSVDMQEIRYIEEEINRKVQLLHNNIIETKKEKTEHLREVNQLKRQCSFSNALVKAATAETFVVTSECIALPSRLQGWSVCRLSKTKGLRPEQYEYDVAISFAGENRQVARDIAHCLRSKGIRVFFDEFEKHLLWGKNLLDYFTEVYFKRAKFCLPLISDLYVRKVWTKPERQAMQARALFSKEDIVLPVRLDDSEVPGMLPTIGFLDFRQEGLEGIVSAVIAKLDASKKKPITG